MSTFTRVACLAVAGCLLLAGPAAAASTADQQEPEWVRDLEKRIDAAVEAAIPHIEAAADAIARAVEEQLGEPPRPPRAGRPGQPPRPPRSQRDQDRDRDRADRGRGPEYTEPFTRTLKLGRTPSLELSNVAGDVVITGGNGDEIRIDAIKRVRDTNEADGRARLRELEIKVIERGGVVEVRTEYPQRRNFSGAVDYTISLPVASNVSVRTVSGDLRITNVRGELRADSVSGDILTSSVGRLRSARSVSGDVQITNAEGDDVGGGTISGDIIVRGLKARSVDFEAVSGGLRFTDAECERLNLKSISGDIDYTGRLARNGRYELQSHSGDITVTPTSNSGFDVEASTFSGDVRSDYGLTVGGPGNNLVGRRGPGRSVRGSIGDASAILSLRSFSGDIVLSKR
jgi:hypothetical protein